MKRKQARLDLVVINTRAPQWGLCAIVDVGERTATIEELTKAKMTRHYAPYGQLNVIVTKEKDGRIPLIDCPVCKTINAPLNYKTTMVKGDKSIDLYECAVCGKVPNLTDDIAIKGYVDVPD